MRLSQWIKRLLILLGMGCCLIALYPFLPGDMGLPTFDAVQKDWQSSDQQILDRHGRLLLTTRIDKEGRRLEWLHREQVAPVFFRTLIAIEDKRFLQHQGIDFRSLAALTRDTLLGRRRGGSTLTMQLVGQLLPELKARGKFRRPWQKLQQLRAAFLLEKFWSKDEILEAYINRVSFRGELQGLAAASVALMEKQAHGLNAEESLLLTAALGTPTSSAAVIARRACRLRSLFPDLADCSTLEKLAKRSLDRAPLLGSKARLAPHLAALADAHETVVPSTLDADIQAEASMALQSHLAALTSQNVHDGAVLVIDNSNAEVLAYVGQSASTTRHPFVDMVRAKRQAGSSLKPLLYASAIDQGLISAASLLDDSPMSLPTSSGIYVPKNYDEKYHGTVTVRQALAGSLNIPAVRVIDMVGVNHFVKTLQQLGFQSLTNAENYGHSLALGAADVSVWELATAYVSLARMGAYQAIKLFKQEQQVPPVPWIQPTSAFVIQKILSDRSARSLTFGLENPLATPFWTAVKTGTSKDMRDNWCAGFSSQYTVVVWVGNADGSPMWNVTGITGAAPVWREVMNALHKDRPSLEPVAPAGVELVSFQSARGTKDQEWFLSGSAPVQQKLADRRWGLRIVHPLDKSLIAFDPDIPESQQALFFRASGNLPKGGGWMLDERNLSGDRLRLSQLNNGRHQLKILGGDGKILDEVQFEMRGGTSVY